MASDYLPQKKKSIITEGVQFLNVINLGHQIHGDTECQQTLCFMDRATYFEKKYNAFRIKINHHIARNDFDGKYFRK